ncbi:MAG: ribonuclease HII [Candidatus Andersenbacteria bacterium]
MPISPTFQYEEQYWKQDIIAVAGVDEAGMGALAGPVVAAAVILKPTAFSKNITSLVRDSKTLSAKRREYLVSLIHHGALAWAVGEASVEEIDTLNIRVASHLAMRRAIDTLSQTPDILLIDGTPATPHPLIPAVNIIDGDALSISIAAASILAKVHRDLLMQEIDKEFPQYGFAGHKGYGAKIHMDALQAHGACPHHRRTYAPVAAVLTVSA